MLARRLTTILPTMNLAEALETARMHRVAGLTGGRTAMVTTRPFRAPHHTISDVGLIGGGQVPLPGDVSLAHHGVFFLDALPEFRRHMLEVLRQPLEDGVVYLQFHGRPESQELRRFSYTGDGREGFGQRTVAAHHDCDSHHDCSVSLPPPLQPLQSSRAFRLTLADAWSTDTSSHRPMSVARVEAPAHTHPSHSYRRAGGHPLALPELWL
jgi:Magnesium chelatase, subunit ChlI